jgi:hypothetical protein
MTPKISAKPKTLQFNRRAHKITNKYFEGNYHIEGLGTNSCMYCY